MEALGSSSERYCARQSLARANLMQQCVNQSPEGNEMIGHFVLSHTPRRRYKEVRTMRTRGDLNLQGHDTILESGVQE